MKNSHTLRKKIERTYWRNYWGGAFKIAFDLKVPQDMKIAPENKTQFCDEDWQIQTILRVDDVFTGIRKLYTDISYCTYSETLTIKQLTDYGMKSLTYPIENDQLYHFRMNPNKVQLNSNLSRYFVAENFEPEEFVGHEWKYTNYAKSRKTKFTIYVNASDHKFLGHPTIIKTSNLEITTQNTDWHDEN